MRDRWEALAHMWNVWVLGYNPERQRDLMSWVGMRDADWRSLTAALFSVLGVMTLALLAWSLGRMARPDPVQRAWRAFCRKLARRGITCAPHEGPRDFSSAPRAPCPPRAAPSCASPRSTSRLRYGPHASRPGVVKLRRMVRELRLA